MSKSESAKVQFQQRFKAAVDLFGQEAAYFGRIMVLEAIVYLNVAFATHWLEIAEWQDVHASFYASLIFLLIVAALCGAFLALLRYDRVVRILFEQMPTPPLRLIRVTLFWLVLYIAAFPFVLLTAILVYPALFILLVIGTAPILHLVVPRELMSPLRLLRITGNFIRRRWVLWLAAASTWLIPEILAWLVADSMAVLYGWPLAASIAFDVLSALIWSALTTLWATMVLYEFLEYGAAFVEVELRRYFGHRRPGDGV